MARKYVLQVLFFAIVFEVSLALLREPDEQVGDGYSQAVLADQFPYVSDQTTPGLTADSAGDLFGGGETLFEISKSGGRVTFVGMAGGTA